jgi:hypothetical protein
MGSIILLAFGACVFPTLLACVAIIISRSPRVRCWSLSMPVVC